MVTQANLHPGVHGPLILSLDVAAEVLVSLREILSKGETDVRKETMIEVKQVLDMLGVEANLSYDGKNKEYYENIPADYEEHGVFLAMDGLVSLPLIFMRPSLSDCGEEDKTGS